ncbi:MAG: hypothetical protein KDI36_12805 [Pseudomonadales bacterium]|nr:hypothetical protein [Pseudomonadales bacterium]
MNLFNHLIERKFYRLPAIAFISVSAISAGINAAEHPGKQYGPSARTTHLFSSNRGQADINPNTLAPTAAGQFPVEQSEGKVFVSYNHGFSKRLQLIKSSPVAADSQPFGSDNLNQLPATAAGYSTGRLFEVKSHSQLNRLLTN